jgi:iron only hydrogenase large subunit-like protein
MTDKNNILEIEPKLRSKKVKLLAMVAPSFVTDFEYPFFVQQLYDLGFDKTTELTFGAKMINRDYHKKLKKSKNLVIASPCPGIVTTIKNRYPQHVKKLIKVDSPMVAMAKVCRKHFPNHKIVFISPCDFKKVEANACPQVDYVIDYDQLRELFKKYKIKKRKCEVLFNRFYNDYTKIYPLSGGLGKTAQVKKILKEEEIAILDGIKNVMGFLDNPDSKVKFFDCLFCNGGCIGGPHTTKKLTIAQKKKKILNYLKEAKQEDIPEDRKGIIKKAKGLKFKGKVWFNTK